MVVQLPSADTPLYSHPLGLLELWLRNQGCEQDRNELHRWTVSRGAWRAELWLDTEQVLVKYVGAGADGGDLARSFKYSLSRRDVEDAVFSGP
jgi:Protein of unknown function (DUF3143)